MNNRLVVFSDISELLTLHGAMALKGRQVQEDDLSIIANAMVISLDGKVVWVGAQSEFQETILDRWGGSKGASYVSMGGCTVLPGFVEAHTHLVFAGDRSQEFELRVQGQTYQEISARGGGIRHTVMETRNASEAELLRTAQARVDNFVRQGVTTLEVKSGYGLDVDTELRCLRVARQLAGPRVVTTYLGAHCRSPEIPEFDRYVQMMCDQVLPRLAKEKLADRVDIYVEKGFFTPEHARTYFAKAKALGLKITAHVEQLSDSGGANVGLEFNPQSLDHLVFVNDQTIAKMAASETTAVLLPASDLYLRMQYPPARQIIDSGVRVAISTDFNPGTSPTQDISLVGVLARLEMKMTLPEVICGFTLNAAYALGLQNECGSISVGKNADFSVVNGSWRGLFYGVGHHSIKSVYRQGQLLQPN